MRFSVIIPVYNRATVVGDAINSVLSQSYKDLEVIVVDDGSTDGTAEVVKNEFGSRVRVLRQENAGPGAARNRGIEVAQGEYATFLDSDDVWFPWTLAAFDQAIRRHDQAAFIAGTHVNNALTQQELSQSNWEQYYKEQWSRDYYTAAEHSPLWIGTPAVAIRLEVLRSVGGFMTAHTNAEDSDLWMKLGTVSGFVRICSPPVFVYRRHGNSAVQNLQKTFSGIRKMVEREKGGRYPGGDARIEQRRKILTRHTRVASLNLARGGHFEQARSLYRETFQWNWDLWRLKYLIGAPLVGFWEFAKSLQRCPVHATF